MVTVTPALKLQWGRNFIVAEIWVSTYGYTAEWTASMGPQLYRCGNLDLLRLHLVQIQASMGPQLYRCGNGYFT